jgi:formylglycine-generating enzyme required for sulfatase activity
LDKLFQFYRICANFRYNTKRYTPFAPGRQPSWLAKDEKHDKTNIKELKNLIIQGNIKYSIIFLREKKGGFFMSEAKNQSVPQGMVAIPAGSFMMGSNGSDDEQPVHKVTLDAFYMDATEVTQADYEALMGVNPSYFRGDGKLSVGCVTWYDAVLYCNARSKQDGLEPVYRYTGVEKGDDGQCVGLKNPAIDFSKNGYRLPTEAEWEYACRAGTTTKYYWGDNMDGAYAWWSSNSDEKTHLVGTKKPNAWGLYDMSGNVWEWCNDWYDKNYYASSSEKNPKGPDSGRCRVLRGGSCDSGDVDDLRSAVRYEGDRDPDYRADNDGFRCLLVR